MKAKYCLTLLALMAGLLVEAQSLSRLSLAEAYDLLEARYPALQDAGVLEKIYQQELKQLDIALLPQLLLKTDGRLQSGSTQLKSEGGMTPIEINQPLVSLRSYVEASYLIRDGGLNEVQRKLQEVALKVDLQKLEVDRYALRDRVNQLVLAISLLREQSKLFDLSLQDLDNRQERIAAGVEYGTILESELSKLEVQQLQIEARRDNLAFQLTALTRTLSALLGVPLSESVQFEFPPLPEPGQVPEIDRPELELFQLQRESILARSELIDVQNRARLSAFAQAGVGYPNPVNILDNNVAPYGILGVQFQWPITDWKKQEADRQLLSLQAQQIDHAKQTFLFNLETGVEKYLTEVQRVQAQIEQDRKIAQLQSDILQQLAIQLDEGIITSLDYLTQLNAEISARQNILIHQTEILQLQLEFWNERGGGW